MPTAASLVTMADSFQRMIYDGELTLPMLPQVVTEVLTLVNDEDSHAAALASLIESDQSLAGHVMRLVNSASFSRMGKVNSLQQAVTRLGMGNIAEIAVAVSISPKLFSTEGYEDMVERLWQTSLATACWSRELARYTRRSSESIFLCGLLHQIGNPVVLQTAIELSQTLKIDLRDDLIEQLLASFQVPVGSELARRWQLPDAVVATIAAFGGEPVEEPYLQMFETVFAARVLAEFMLNTEQVDGDDLAGHPALFAIGVEDGDIDELLAMEDQIRESVSALSV